MSHNLEIGLSLVVTKFRGCKVHALSNRQGSRNPGGQNKLSKHLAEGSFKISLHKREDKLYLELLDDSDDGAAPVAAAVSPVSSLLVILFRRFRSFWSRS